MEHVDTRAGRVAFERSGAGDPLFLLHAAGHDHHDFDAIVPTLSHRFTTVALDWPGFGESDAPQNPRAVTASLMYDVLEDIVDALRLGPAIFLGNSMGGSAALRLASRRPELVRRLVLVATSGWFVPNVFERAVCHVQGDERVRRVTNHAFAKAYMARRNPLVDQILARMEQAYQRPSTVQVHAALWRSFAEPSSDLSSEARRVRCPTLLVWGRRDPVLSPLLKGRAARKAMSGATHVELDTGHVPFAESPEEFLEVVAPFLEGRGESAPLA